MPSIVRKISKFTQREITDLFNRARRVIRNEACTILAAPRSGEFGRILIVASRKVGNAPERNVVRRRIKAIFYEEKLFSHGFDFVIIVQKKAVTLPFDQLKELLLTAYQKACLIHEDSSRK